MCNSAAASSSSSRRHANKVCGSCAESEICGSLLKSSDEQCSRYNERWISRLVLDYDRKMSPVNTEAMEVGVISMVVTDHNKRSRGSSTQNLV